MSIGPGEQGLGSWGAEVLSRALQPCPRWGGQYLETISCGLQLKILLTATLGSPHTPCFYIPGLGES